MLGNRRSFLLGVGLFVSVISHATADHIKADLSRYINSNTGLNEEADGDA